MKKVVAFDLDGTLAPSKSSISAQMDKALSALLDRTTVCVISGGRFEQFQSQLLDNFSATPDEYENLHLMPTSGTHYLRYKNDEWQTRYIETIPESDRRQIIRALNAAIEEFGYDELETYGEQIEDRRSQVTLSIFGQEIAQKLGQEGIDIKETWDPNHSKRRQMIDFMGQQLPENVEPMIGGSSSIDVVMRGVDKSYGMKKLIEELNITKQDVLFFGDALQPGGNDYPVKEFGIESVAVKSPAETLEAIIKILAKDNSD